MRKHRLAIVAPGHFHAALALREPHPRLDDEVRVYAPAGPEVEAFLALVESFNARAVAPTRWRLTAHVGPDWLDRSVADRAADLAVLAGRNDGKLALVRRLHAAGLHLLADKPLLIDAEGLAGLEAALSRPPLVMELMTGRHEPGNRVLAAIAGSAEAFGGFRADGAEPAISIRSTHHLRKTVNGAPLVRPAWYFDTGVQGEGMVDVTTHLVDAVQGLAPGPLSLRAARQWPTKVPREAFAEIAGFDDFPAALADRVEGGSLALRCNAALRFTVGGVPVDVESLWALSEPPGGGDTHYATLRGERATLLLALGPETGGAPQVDVQPTADGPAYVEALNAALAGLGRALPAAGGYRVEIAADARSGHEEHFALVLDRFLAAVDAGRLPDGEAARCLAKYRLLTEAKALSHRGG